LKNQSTVRWLLRLSDENKCTTRQISAPNHTPAGCHEHYVNFLKKNFMSGIALFVIKRTSSAKRITRRYIRLCNYKEQTTLHIILNAPIHKRL